MRRQLLRIGVMASLFSPLRVFAASPPPASATTEQCKGLTAVVGNTECNDAAATSLTGRVGDIIDVLFLVAGAVAVIIIVLSGIRYITSTGDAARIKAAKDSLLYAIIGLIVVILARAIVGFVIGNIG